MAKKKAAKKASKKVSKKASKSKVKPKKASKKVQKKAVKKAVKKVAKKVAKKPALKAVASKPAAKAKPEPQPLSKVAESTKKVRTKSEIFGILAQSSGLSKKEVSQVFDNLYELISMDLGKKGPGTFSMPGMMKIVKVTKPATKARQGINPFTKEPMTFKAKPARNVVKVRLLKGVKEMVAK